jgi:glycosyltransferase involved in cell wall biosynthesis
LRPVVLQLIDSFHQGGSERQAIQLTRLLRESNRFDVRLASLNSEGSLRSQAEALHLSEIPSFPLTSFYDRNALVQLRRLMAFLRRSRVEILHTHDFYTNVFGMAAGSFARVPARIASMRETAGMRTASQKSAQQFAYAMAHQVLANSEAVRRKLIQQGIKDTKVSVIYNGLDTKRMVPTSRAEALSIVGLPSETAGAERRFVTIVANMRHEVKDYPMLLRAARRVAEVVSEASFLLAGEGELSDQLKRLARELGIEQRTHFLGRCEKIGALLQVSDVCVLSSKAEGFSNAILEYMAAARPVVATDVGGAAEAIVQGETGYLVESGDDEAMAERIISLLREPDRARAMGERGRRVVEERISCAGQLKRTEELYDKLLSRAKVKTET